MISALQVAVGTSSATLLQMPPGACEVTITAGEDAVTIGNQHVTVTNGYVLAAGASVTFHGYVGSTATQLLAIGSASTSVSVLISTAY